MLWVFKGCVYGNGLASNDFQLGSYLTAFAVVVNKKKNETNKVNKRIAILHII